MSQRWKTLTRQKTIGRNRTSGIKLSSSQDKVFCNTTFLKDLTENNDGNAVLDYLKANLDDYSKAVETRFSNDLLFAITEMIAKICDSKSIAHKYQVLRATLNKNFIISWNQLIILTESKEYKKTDFRIKITKNLGNVLVIFAHCLDLLPSLCWHMIKSTLRILYKNKLLEVELSTEFIYNFDIKLDSLLEEIEICENRFCKKSVKSSLEPEDDYRSINIFPTTKELVTRERNFVRKNIVVGPYNDVHHYLDVMFRLQREDFLNPIREDISDYLSNIKRHFFNIKIFEDVTILNETFNKSDICFTVKFKVNKKLENHLKNNHKPRFMNDSLLIFSDDDFQTTFCGLVSDSKSIQNGLLTVAFEETLTKCKKTYKMIECSVYFQPYFHVLKVLQSLRQTDLPVSKYIVDVQTAIARPRYLLNYSDELEDIFNDSQKKAFRAALNQEFVVIQGPPGTGKTFIGLKIIEHLLKYQTGPILVVCYTNHALDQFLEGLLPYTKKLVRLGSQSKSKILSEEHNLRKKRRKLRIKTSTSGEREKMDNSVKLIRRLDNFIKILQNPVGIIKINILINNVSCLRNSCFSSFTDEEFILWLLQDTKKEDGENVDDYVHLRYIYKNYLDVSKHKSEYILLNNEMNKWLCDIEKSLASIKQDVDDLNYAFLNNDFYEEQYEEYLADCDVQINTFQKDFNFIKTKIELLNYFLNKRCEPPKVELKDPFNMSTETRWELYHYWLQRAEEALNVLKIQEIRNYRATYVKFDNQMNIANIETLRKMDIIGMTTTCAAKMHNILEKVKCPIVVVEEAAEVVEPHIITALTEHCQHLILLGDHQQLKPSTSDYTIEREYKLGISLFERMVKNNIQCHTLGVQHRMRPEIASLITPVIYSDLKNHISVLNYPEVKGATNPIYFIDHKNPESNFGDSSKLNNFEAKYLIELAKYFLKNGYSPEEVTILAAYTGQVVTLKNLMAKIDPKSKCNINITSVDNFQGEESKIILLSLVRNNEEGNVGFLSIENRICVALSRAKEGLYIMGNMDQLCAASKVWKSIRNTLSDQKAIGSSLPLKCQIHDTVTMIEEPEDFEKVPEGGCNMECMAKLNCGHICKRKCHPSDLEHKNEYKCIEMCLKQICENPLHQLCQKRCYKKCSDYCYDLLSVTLSCGHKKSVPCHAKNDLSKFKCNVSISVTLACGHENERLCSESVEKMKCTFKEVVTLSCGHEVEKLCDVSVKTLKCVKHKQYKCKIVSKKENLKCSKIVNKHYSTVPCYQQAPICLEKVVKYKKLCSHRFDNVECSKDINKMKCVKPCKKTLTCGHSCTKTCEKPCEPCLKEISIQGRCGHWLNQICGAPSQLKCTNTCKKLLQCGHPCVNKCSEICTTTCKTCNGISRELLHTEAYLRFRRSLLRK